MDFSGSPFLADSGSKELDDGLLGQMKASTAYLLHGKLQVLPNQLNILTYMGGGGGFAAYNCFLS